MTFCFLPACAVEYVNQCMIYFQKSYKLTLIVFVCDECRIEVVCFGWFSNLFNTSVMQIEMNNSVDTLR